MFEGVFLYISSKKMGEVTEAMDAFQLFATECNDIDIEVNK